MQALLAARQEREIQLKMLLTRGEAVQRNTSAEGIPVIRKQIQDLKDSWDSLLSSCIRCKRLLSSHSLSFDECYDHSPCWHCFVHVTANWKVRCHDGPAIRRTWVNLYYGWIGLRRHWTVQTDSFLRWETRPLTLERSRYYILCKAHSNWEVLRYTYYFSYE